MTPNKQMLVLALTTILWTSAVWSENPSSSPAGDGAFFAISVADLDSMIAWYEENLALELVSRGDNEQRAGALLHGPGLLIELAEFHGARPLADVSAGIQSHEVHGIFKIGLLVDDVDARFEKAKAAGVEIFFPVVAADDRLRTFGILDPEGNIIQFFSR
jgi:catechol 2,3-dioxygenase-like lactoylglutathione lyase family enzyme